ncbi:catalase [Cryptococcus deuterogattii 99/473]|uniref:Catalase n=2 Tax=Cryptococcus deuterogattii TaxID=1859096 RepID=A0A0D0UY53_9TREE|nr:catalase [Cryptococcus deuterogattii R265]KIR26100.1 catalase [Cryptococcus deuterogattii LA55]KIR31794.1 catalase [Cryptococcus deuterogattii MMRL2647]KIR37670.1 catalase [Cryptococcus deuterogattii Ram5]KIR70282.1 catalase [Cryptococcus deuterogattii CA1014]KIR89830.1 catalase [Cryptococcus deuterogattii CBS 10090]KIY54581.1 catalase [Cryptococcus deuterogattii 99/473]
MAEKTPTYTLSEGCPIADATTAQRLGGSCPVKGLMLLQDTQLIETLAHFSRERIPARTVHASAVGAWGEFEVTHDNSDITSAAFLNGIGKKSKVLMRISTVGPDAGTAETVRDVRGWSMKIFTEEGNQDFVFNSIPVFFIRDPIKFPSVNRSHKRHPAKHTADSSMFWDFHNNNPEGIHAVMMLFSNRGLPYSLRQINAYSGHTYKLTKSDGSFVYVKLHFKSNQGVKGMTQAEGIRTAGESPDFHTIDMWNAIERGDYPTWTLCAQVMKPEEAENYRWNIFDMTKVWPHKDFPLRPLGKLTLNRNPENYFSDIEQAAFSPSTMVPGIAPSGDPMLQARMFAYPDAARYRLGVNYQQLPCNRPVSEVYAPYQRDGAMRYMTNYGDDPNYVRSSLKEINFKGQLGANGHSTGGNEKHDEWVGRVTAYTSEVTDEDFVQARMLWEVLGKAGDQEDLITNVSEHLCQAIPSLQKGAIDMFAKVNVDLAKSIEGRLTELNKGK